MFCLPRGVCPSAGLPPPPLPGPPFDGDGSTTRCPDRIRRPAVGIVRLGTRSTRATVTCYATTTDHMHQLVDADVVAEPVWLRRRPYKGLLGCGCRSCTTHRELAGAWCEALALQPSGTRDSH